jgi:hypothetical protein
MVILFASLSSASTFEPTLAMNLSAGVHSLERITHNPSLSGSLLLARVVHNGMVTGTLLAQAVDVACGVSVDHS